VRDLELDYLEQVGHTTHAAGAVERGDFRTAYFEAIAPQDDALGQFARVFARMADDVRAGNSACPERCPRLCRSSPNHALSTTLDLALQSQIHRPSAFF
jgi:hypothetical protein